MQAQESQLSSTAWQLYDSSWQLLYVVHQATEGLAAFQAADSSSSRPKQSSLPGGGGGWGPSSLPAAINRRIAALSVLNRIDG